jgi:flagellar M-ring protein FliF
MDAKDVNITNLGDGGAYGTDGTDALALLEDDYLKAKVTFEMQKKESILNALRDIPGVRVEVNAELDDTFEQTQRIVKPDKVSATPSRTVTVTEDSNQTTTKGGGQPGTIAQGPTRQGANASPQQNTNTIKNSTEETTSIVGIDENTTRKKGYAPKEVWATIAVPSTYLENLWKQRNPTASDPPKPEDLRDLETSVKTKVEEVVEPLLILQANLGRDNYKHVKVVVLDSLAAPAIAPPSMATTAASWAGRYWSTLAMVGVAMFSLLILRSVVKSIPGDGTTPSAAAPTLTLHTDEPAARADAGGESPADDRPRLRLKKGKSLKDDLVQIVHDDPDAAADILRAWIGKAG